MQPALLVLDDLTVGYGAREAPLRAVEGVSLTLARGEALGIVGESGSGKSTIVGSVLDLLGSGAHILGGRILFDGRDLASLDPSTRRGLLGSRIGTVFQDPFTSLDPAFKAGRHVAEPLVQHRNYSWAAAERRAVELLGELGIRDAEAVANAYPHQLSGGMKQRVMIAAAIACEPDLLILDEPTTALDVTVEAQLLDLLGELRRRRNMSVLFISHNLAVVEKVCDRVCVLYAGRVMELGAAREVFHAPAHPYAKGLLASLPRIGAREVALSPIPGRFPNLLDMPTGCVFHPRCPFVEPDCATWQPRPVQIAAQRTALCRRQPEIAASPWPVAALPSRSPVPTLATGSLIEARGLGRTFPLGHRYSLLPKDGSRRLVARDPITVDAVRDVDIAIAPGEIVGLVGESGSGKSTLGRLLLRLLEPSRGSIRLLGEEIAHSSLADLKPLRGVAQMVFQNPDSSLNPRITIGDALGRPVQLFDERTTDVSLRVRELLDVVQLPAHYADRYPHQLSGGEKQRVGIARALATNPKFIVCDEAISALDVSVQAAIVNLLADLRTRMGTALLFISHDLSVVASLADRVMVLYRGMVCEVGATKDILSPPYHPYTQALLSAMPELSGARIQLRAMEPVRARDLGGCRFADRCPVQIEGVCDRVVPPARTFPAGHVVHCHLEPEQLASMVDIVKAGLRSQQHNAGFDTAGAL